MQPVTIAGQAVRLLLYICLALSGYLSASLEWRKLVGDLGMMWTGAVTVIFVTVRAFIDRSSGSNEPVEVVNPKGVTLAVTPEVSDESEAP